MAMMAEGTKHTKRTLQALVDRLPDPRAALLSRGLRGDPGLLSLAFIPEDDEPVTDEERAAVALAEQDVRAGRVLPWADVRDRWLRR